MSSCIDKAYENFDKMGANLHKGIDVWKVMYVYLDKFINNDENVSDPQPATTQFLWLGRDISFLPDHKAQVLTHLENESCIWSATNQFNKSNETLEKELSS